MQLINGECWRYKVFSLWYYNLIFYVNIALKSQLHGASRTTASSIGVCCDWEGSGNVIRCRLKNTSLFRTIYQTRIKSFQAKF